MTIVWDSFPRLHFSWFLDALKKGAVRNGQYVGGGSCGELDFDVHVKFRAGSVILVCDVFAYEENNEDLFGYSYEDMGRFVIGTLTDTSTYDLFCIAAQEALDVFIASRSDGDDLEYKASLPKPVLL